MTPLRPTGPAPSRLDRLAQAVGALGGLGHVPVAPGTAASLAAILVAAAAPAQAYGAVIAALCVAASAAAPAAARAMTKATGDEDPRAFVLDEAAGIWLAALRPTPPAPLELAAIFVLFRLLDIWKPWPIRPLERIGGGWGVLLDDLAAGAIAGAVVYAARAWLR